MSAQTLRVRSWSGRDRSEDGLHGGVSRHVGGGHGVVDDQVPADAHGCRAYSRIV